MTSSTSLNLKTCIIPRHIRHSGGLILEELKYIPRPGDRLDWNNIRFEILSMNGAKIEKVLVTITPRQEA